jgi:predicted transcriptional regulator
MAQAKHLVSLESPKRVEMVKEFLTHLEDTKNLNAEKLNHVFNMIDDQLTADSKGFGGLDKVDLERSALAGLNNRRSEMEILAFMLKSARNGVIKTAILYSANLSGRQLKKYLTFLTNAGFLQEEAKKKRGALFTTTSKGSLFLYHWIKMLNLLETKPEENTTALD